jgi:S1-C subfamily serine protease
MTLGLLDLHTSGANAGGMNRCHRGLSCLLMAGGILLIGCDSPPPTSSAADTDTPIAPEPARPLNTLRYSRPPESLAEMNPHGFHDLRDGTTVTMMKRDPIVDSTPLGRRVMELQSRNAQQLSALPRWRKLTAPELYEWFDILSNAKQEDWAIMRFELLSEAAGMGHADAQLQLAMCYLNGTGITQNIYHAANWAMKSADAGNARGAYMAYSLFANSKGAAEWSDGLARKYLIEAAQLGNPVAQAQLGYSLTGLAPRSRALLKQDVEAAKKWLLIAAKHPLTERSSDIEKQGKALGLFYLGAMYGRGVGVPKNELESLAHYYLSKSVYMFKGNFGYVERNIKHREANMTSSARQYSQMRAQELRPLYFDTPVTGEAKTPNQPTIGFGSGVFVTKAGHILTAAHVIENASKVMARVGESPIEAEIVAVDYPNDVALLKVDAAVDAAPVRPSASVALGNGVFTIGFPNMLLQGTEPKFTEGTISSTSGMRDDPRQFQVSVQVQPGNSGGALFDENGNVVGLVVARLDDEATTKLTGSAPQNVNYAVKSSYALPLIESLKTELLAEQRPSWFRRPDREQVVGNAKKASVPLVVERRPERQ